MKPTLLLPPVVALIVAVAWVGNGRQKIASLEKESAVLKQRLAARSDGLSAGDPSSRAKPPGKPAKGKEPIDWKQVAAQMLEMNRGGGMGDMRTMIRLQQRIQSMEREELVAALDEIAAMDLPEKSRQMLEQMLIGQLCQKDPELALTRYLDRISEERGAMSWQLSNAMKEWTKKDPANAIAWFDKQIAAGRFDSKSLNGKSRPRMQFEGALIANLLSTDEAAAAARLEALPENQRGELLRHYSASDLKDGDQLAYANLVREGVPESEQGLALAQIASHKARGDGYADVTGYFDRIKATPAERAACMEQVTDSKIENLSQTRKINAEDIDAMRAWMTTQSPDTTDHMTGTAIARSTELNQQLEFSEASALALKYHEASGNDEVLIGFLSSSAAHSHKDEARELAKKISDVARRDEILENY